MSQPTYRFRTESGFSRYYTLPRLREKASEGAVNEATECTPDEGVTWIPLGTLLQAGADGPEETHNEQPESATTSPSSQDDTTAMEPADSNSDDASSAARKLTRLARSSGKSRFAKVSQDRRQQKSAATVRKPQDFIGVSLADDRYKIVNQLGKGSMAYVFRAADNRLQTDVVVKIPKPEKLTGDEIRERFRRESQLLVRLAHPHVVKVLDVGEYEEIPYVVMQLLSGGTLADKIEAASDTSKRMEVGSLKSWIREVGRALDFCARQGTVHRDVKPANILFDDDNNAYVSDFGLTKIMYGEHTSLNSSETTTGIVLGTPNYIAPEIVQGNNYDGRADQYSLGITVYHSLVGRAPMQGKSATLTMINQTQKQLQLLSDIRSDVPRDVALAIRRAIEKDPKKRFDSCTEFAEAVVDGLRGESSQESSSGASTIRTASGTQTPRRRASDRSGRSSRSSVQRKRPAASSHSGIYDDYKSDGSDWLDAGNSSLPPRRSGRKSTKKKSKNRFSIHPVLAVAACFGAVLLVSTIFYFFGTNTTPPEAVVGPGPDTEQYADDTKAAAQVTATDTVDADTAEGTPVAVESNKGGTETTESPQVPNSNGSSEPAKNAVAAKPVVPDVARKARGSAGEEPAVMAEVVPADGAKVAATQSSESITTPAETVFRPVSGNVIPCESEHRVTAGFASAQLLVAGTTVWDKGARSVRAQLKGTYPADAHTAISPDAQLFAAATKSPGKEATGVTVWNTETGESLFTAFGTEDQYADVVMLSTDRLFIGSRGSDSMAVWNCTTGKPDSPVRIEHAQFRPNNAAVSSNGQYIAAVVNGQMMVTDAGSGKSIWMQPPAQKTRFKRVSLKSSGRTQRRRPEPAGGVFSALQALKFSPNNQELSAFSTHPDARILCWSGKGQLVADERVSSLGAAMGAASFQWFDRREAWLISGRIRDRGTGRILYVPKTTGMRAAEVHIYDDDHLAAPPDGTSNNYVIAPIPWSTIDAGLQAMNSNSALLSPQSAVSFNIDLAPHITANSSQHSDVTKAFRGLITREGMKVEDDRLIIFQLRIAGSDDEKESLFHRQWPSVSLPAPPADLIADDGDCVIAELVVPIEKQPLWRVNLGPVDEFKLTASGTKDVTALIARINELAIPYYIPRDKEKTGLPVVAGIAAD